MGVSPTMTHTATPAPKDVVAFQPYE